MSAMMSVVTNDQIHLRHDLMIEIERIEMALEDARERGAANQPTAIASLEKRRALLTDALVRLTA
jgi:hypothetical protein